MNHVHDRIRKIIDENRVMLFMKGTPDRPMCGFSMRAVQVLGMTGVDFGSFDVLSDDDVRQGIKSYANWPTIPQLYIDGQLVGGSDILIELYQSGELQPMLTPKADAESE